MCASVHSGLPNLYSIMFYPAMCVCLYAQSTVAMGKTSVSIGSSSDDHVQKEAYVHEKIIRPGEDNTFLIYSLHDLADTIVPVFDDVIITST